MNENLGNVKTQSKGSTQWRNMYPWEVRQREIYKFSTLYSRLSQAVYTREEKANPTNMKNRNK